MGVELVAIERQIQVAINPDADLAAEGHDREGYLLAGAGGGLEGGARDALVAASELDEDIVNQTLNVILKYEGDVRKAQGELSKLLERKAAEVQAERSPGEPPPARPTVKKGALH